MIAYTLSNIKILLKCLKLTPGNLLERLVIENDDHLYSVQDCYRVYELINTPIIFDNLHHLLEILFTEHLLKILDLPVIFLNNCWVRDSKCIRYFKKFRFS
jgi:UV DNA damage repair endonuclease